MMIGFDIDGVLADFVTPFLLLLERRAGRGPIKPEAYADPNFSDHPFLSKEIVSECLSDISDDPNFWQALAPIPSRHQWRSLDRLSREGRLVFLTHRWQRDTYDINQITCSWLEKHGVSNPVVHVTQEKKSLLIQKLDVKLFVDDRHENCEDVATQTDALVMMPHRPYNRSLNHPKVRRIQDLDEFFVYLTSR